MPPWWEKVGAEWHDSFAHVDYTFVGSWFAFVWFGFFVLKIIFKKGWGPQAFRHKPGVAAHMTVAIAPIVMTTVYGFRGWLKHGRPSNLDDRLFTEYPEARDILMIQVAYQLFSITVSLWEGPPLDSSAMLAHHSVTLILALLDLRPYIQYYCMYFGGVIEISNWPLTLMDYFKTFPALRDQYPLANQCSRVTFAILFIIFRVVLWLWIAVEFHYDSFRHLVSPDLINPCGTIANIVGNIFMTGLQLFWGRKVVCGLVALVCGKTKNSKAVEETTPLVSAMKKKNHYGAAAHPEKHVAYRSSDEIIDV